MAETKTEHKFPSEVIDLPSEGRVYPGDHPLNSGKIEIKYMTAKEEDILTSQNLIKKGVVVTKLIDSLILTPNVTSSDLVMGDKNAVMVAARVLAYGPEYMCEMIHPQTGEKFNHTFDLTDCPFKKLPKGINGNDFEFQLPASKTKVNYRLLTGKEEEMIDQEIKSVSKVGHSVSPELTTRLRYTITAVDGNEDKSTITHFVQNMLARDSMVLRQELNRVAPDIELTQEIDIEGESVKVAVPMTANFFWPST